MPPFNGSGTFTPFTPGNPVVPGTVISSTAFNSTQSDIAAGLTNAITRDGQSPPSANLPMGGRKLTGLGPGAIAGDSLRWEQLFSQGTEQDLASAATTDVGAQNTTVLRITGTTGITSFGTNYNGPRFVRFAGILTLTNSATLVLPTGANITTAAGDRAILTPIGNPAAGWQVLAYQRADGTALNGIAVGPVTTSGLTMATARGLGRLTAGPGPIEELTSAQITASLVDAATDALPGKIEIATDAEAQTGTDPARAVTPAGIRAAFNASGTAPVYACRGWVNFNGTGAVAIRGSGNVSSITDHGTGEYTVNLTTALQDANYAANVTGGGTVSSGAARAADEVTPRTASALRIITLSTVPALQDQAQISVSFFR